MTRGAKAWVASGKKNDQIVDALFVSALGRQPTNREMQTAQNVVGATATEQGVEDLLWILAMHPEYQLIP